jgi:hypothetical protein
MYCNCLQAYDNLHIPKVVLPSRNDGIISKQCTMNNNSNTLRVFFWNDSNFCGQFIRTYGKTYWVKIPMSCVQQVALNTAILKYFAHSSDQTRHTNLQILMSSSRRHYRLYRYLGDRARGVCQALVYTLWGYQASVRSKLDAPTILPSRKQPPVTV